MPDYQTIPIGWAARPVGELFDLDSGVAPVRFRPSDLSGPVLVYGANGPIGSSDLDNYGPGYLVGRVGAAGAVARVDSRIWASDNALTLTPKIGVCSYAFAGHILRFINVPGLATTTAQPLVTQSNLSRLATLTPVDIAEQSRIALVLDTVDEAIAKAEAVMAKLRQVRAGLLHDLLTRGLDQNGQLRDPIAHPEQFQPSPLGQIPKEWEVATLVSRITLPQGQVDPRVEPYCDWTLVAPDHIESETGRLLGRQTARQQDAISGKYVFESGDVVYSKIRPYLRKAVLATERGLCSADMYPLRPNAGLNPRFLLAAVLGESFSRFASAVSMRSGFPKINRDELAEFAMGWPDSDEQDRIATGLAASDDEQTAIEREWAKLRQLKSGLIIDLLTGRVRVPVEGKAP